MAFDENPIVDNNSKNSEESVLFIKSIFCQKNGFICRTESPDFGVDELVELLRFDDKNKTFQQATNKRFVLQLKSLEQIPHDKIIKKSNKDFIKISFKSSRLNYLLEYTPAYGLIIVYDALTKNAYFDYAEEVYKNLNEFHNGESWKKKDKPTIYIPFKNELNVVSLKTIHDFFYKRHENTESLVSNHGQAYNIPSFKKPSLKELDFRNTQDIKKVLLKYGWSLIDDNDFDLIESMLCSLSHREILNDPTLCLLKATVSCEIGSHLDADYFLSKYDQVNRIVDSELPRKKFLINKIDFILGKISYKEFIKNVTELRQTVTDEYNKLLIDINIIFMSFLKTSSSGGSNIDSFEQVVNLFKKIESSGVEIKKKHYLKIYHISNLIVFVTDFIREKFFKFKIKQSMGINFPLLERGKEVKEIISKVEFFKKLTLETWEYGIKNHDKFLIATSMYNIANYQFVFNFNIALLEGKKYRQKTHEKENFTKHINYSFSSYKIFSDLTKNYNAYLSLILAYELTLFYKILYGETINNDPKLIEENIRGIEVQMGYKPYESIVKSSQSNLVFKKQRPLQNFEEIDESNIDLVVNTLCKSMDLPDDRKTFIKADIISIKYFYANRKSENLELFQNLFHTKNKSTYYKYPLTYSVHCIRCNKLTDWNTNIEHVLKSANDHKC